MTPSTSQIQDAVDAWTPPVTGKRGAQAIYSDVAIETALALRLLFRLPLRQVDCRSVQLSPYWPPTLDTPAPR